jgi:hypothetical protein
MNEMKTCHKCGETKLLNEFYKSGKTTGSGYRALCIVCDKNRSLSYYVKNKEHRKEYARKHYIQYTGRDLDNRFKSMLSNARKRKKIEFSLTLNDLHVVWGKQNGLCAYTKLPLTSESHQLNTASLDRIDSCKGYVEDNIQLVCVSINEMKLDYSEKQFINLCSLVAQNCK